MIRPGGARGDGGMRCAPQWWRWSTQLNRVEGKVAFLLLLVLLLCYLSSCVIGGGKISLVIGE